MMRLRPTVLLALLACRASRRTASAAEGLNLTAVLPLNATAYGTALTAVVAIGDQAFNLLPDTGSSDLWVLDPEWRCHAVNASGILGAVVPRADCAYGNGTYTPGSGFTVIGDAWFGEHYGAGDVLGTLGTDTMRIGNISLPRQEFGIVNATNGASDRFSEGILGLGYPVLSQTHPNNFTAKTPFDFLRNRLPSRTTVLSLVEALAEPYFAFALERPPPRQEIAFGGYMSFGTLPPVPHSEQWTSIPVEVTDAVPAAFTGGVEQRTYWTTTVSSISWSNETYDIPYQTVLDTGNFYFNVPSKLAERVASAFDPPGTYNPDGPLGPIYAVDCDATLPSNVSIELGGTNFKVDGQDLIYRDFEGECFSTFAPTEPLRGIALFFLGSKFLMNVVAVFDYSHNEMRFAERIRNGSSESPQAPQPTVPTQVGNEASSLAFSQPFAALVLLALTLLT